MNATQKQLVKKLSLWTIIFLAGVGTAILVRYLSLPKNFEHKWSQRIPPERAQPNLEKYRNPRALLTLSMTRGAKIDGLLHHPDSLRKYLDEIDVFRSEHPVTAPLYWGVGFYPNVVRDTTTNRVKLNLYIIPTLYKASGINPLVITEVYDYYSTVASGNSLKQHYISFGTSALRHHAGDYIFDEGHLWP